jgi:biotin carboxylase
MRVLERLLVLGAGTGQLGLLAAAKDRGLFVIAVDRDPAAPGFRYADRRAIVSVEDEPALERLAEAARIDGVIAPGSDWPVGPAARIAARLGLHHPISPATAVLSTSKLRQRERLAEAGVPQPHWQLVSKADEVVRVPCLVRPPDRQGRSARALVRSSRDLRGAIAAALRSSRLGLALVEELVEEPVVTVSAFSRDGVFHPLAVTDRTPFAHVWESAHAREAAAIAARAALALGVCEGPTVTQLLAGRDGLKVLELSARIGGDREPELCRTAVGVDLHALALSAALGEPVSARRLRTERRVGGACVCEVEGTVVLETAASPEEALARATRAAECIRFRAADAHAV